MDRNNTAPYDIIAMDITSYCNLKCPFCLSDHSIQKQRMDRDTFRKAISLLALVKGHSFLFSCLYEPTLHPDFLNFIQEIPGDQRHKVFFSTNLSISLADSTIEELSLSGLHHINISVDSLKKETYEVLRKGAKFTVFLDNLSRLAASFKDIENAPQLHFISIVNKCNVNEIPELIGLCAEKYHAHFHDIREYWLLSHQIELEWCKKQKLTEHEVDRLRKSLAGLKYNLAFTAAANNRGVYHPGDHHKEFDVIDEKSRRANLYHLPTGNKGLRIHANGKVEVLGRNITFNLNSLADPSSLFLDLAAYIDLDIAKTEELQKVSGKLLLKSVVVTSEKNLCYHLDEIQHEPKKLTFRGWCFDRNSREVNITFFYPDKAAVAVEYSPQESPDVEIQYGSRAGRCRFIFEVYLNYNFSVDDLERMSIDFSTAPPSGKYGARTKPHTGFSAIKAFFTQPLRREKELEKLSIQSDHRLEINKSDIRMS